MAGRIRSVPDCTDLSRPPASRPAEYAAKVDLGDLVKDAGDVPRTREDMLLPILFPGLARAFLEKVRCRTPVGVA